MASIAAYASGADVEFVGVFSDVLGSVLVWVLLITRFVLLCCGIGCLVLLPCCC